MKRFVVCAVVAALSICRLHAACDPAPAGLVGWWPGEGNGEDVVAGNNGTLVNVGFTSGEVGQAFSFDPENYPYFTYTGVQIADQPAYALTNSLSIEGWVRPRGDGYVIFFRGDHRPGLDPYALSMQNSDRLDFQVTDAGGNSAVVETVIPYNVWTHVAATLDGATGTMSIYTNGLLAAQTVTAVRPFGALDPNQSPGIGIGNVNDGGNNFPFTGDIDEISLYNRALSSNEIAAIYNAGSSGKCPLPPTIITPPMNQTVEVGKTAVFSVVAGGGPPLSYQWSANGTNISNETNATLVLNSVQFSDAGSYAVQVANGGGTTNSASASLTVIPTPPCDPAPAGLVGWWPGEGNGLDAVAGNNGTLVNVGFTGGEVGQAFSFDPENYPYFTYTGVQIADQPAYALTNSLSIEGWVRPRGDGYVIFFRGDHRPGLDPYALAMQNSDRLDFQVTDANGNAAVVETVIPYNVWTHVAATLDGATGTMSIYTNGLLAAQTVTTVRPFGALDPNQSPGIGIGNVNDGGNNFPFTGDIDEIALYNRALSSNEIAAIYNAGSSGKCPLPPTIITPPMNQTVEVGKTAVFSVVAGGGPPLSYQWSANGTNIFNATNATLVLNSVQFSDAGSYAVQVANGSGTTNSASASLTVIPTPPCDPAPSGLVGWWPGEGNGEDVVAGNNGTLVNVGFTSGEVGQAFSFDPENYPYFTYTGVQIADQPAYALTNSLSIEGWVRPRGDGYVIFFRGDHRPGLDPYALAMQNSDRLDFQVTDANGNSAVVETIIPYNVWTHVAATLDGATGTMSIYTNGLLAAQTVTTVRPFGALDPNQSPGIGIGNVNDGGNQFPFFGDIDEISLYNRALSSNEIAAIYNAGSSGKCDSVVADATATVSLVISANGSNATVVLDGSRSYDPFNRPLQYSWFADKTNLLATGVVAVVTLPVGTNSITLLASDGSSSNAQTIAVDVITVQQAVDQLVAAVNQDVARQQPLVALLRAALASLDRSNPVSAINQLQAFQNKVQAQLGPIDPALAQSFINDAQAIIDAIASGGNGRTKLNMSVDLSGNKLHLNFHGSSGQAYIIEASSDMVNWQKIGVAQDQGAGTFNYSENPPDGVTPRFYRVVKP